jgi:XTP/dITP diphosphohydrolase
VQSRHLGQWVLGEDSGLSVEALNGQPNIYSARFAGPGATDEKNNTLLLQRLQGVPRERRTAYYTCHMALSDPDGKIWISSQSHCRGRILLQPHGQGGFGYDPLFEIPEYHQTFGQLGPDVKALISHRARAARAFLREWRRLGHALASASRAVG